MKRRLWLVNLTLIAGIVSGSWLWWKRAVEARQRRAAILTGDAKRGVKPPQPATPAAGPVQASAYLEIAQNLLFSKDRNPNVELEPPPPPKPMPPLPKAHGVLMLADPPSVILSEKAGSPQRGYRPGERVGAFKVIAVTSLDIELEWEGKRVRRTLEELTDKTAAPVQAPEAPPAAAAASPAQASTVIAGAAKPPERADQPRPCDPGDTSPEGTVVNGMRKVYSNSPFGRICRWDPAK